jgi:hypothetical protein
MKPISRNYALIHNLIESAKWHREHCHSSCAVSLHMIKEVCWNLEQDVWDDEHKLVEDEINDTDWG